MSEQGQRNGVEAWGKRKRGNMQARVKREKRKRGTDFAQTVI